MEGYILPDVFTFNFFSVDRTLNAFKHKENAKLPEDVRLSNLVRYQARQAMNEYENTLMAKSKGYDVWLDDKEAYDWQQRTLRECEWVVPLPKFKKTFFADPKKRRCYTPDSKARQVISYWQKHAETNTHAIARMNFEIWRNEESRKKAAAPPRQHYIGEWNEQAQPIPMLFNLSDVDWDEALRCDEDPIVIPDSPLPTAIAEDGGNKWDSDGDLFIPCAQRIPDPPISIEDISDAETESIGRGDPEEPLDEGFDEAEDYALAVWTADVEKRENLKAILTGLHRAISACEERGAVERWKGKSTKDRLQRLRAGWSTRKRKYDEVCDRLDDSERGMDRYRAHKRQSKRVKYAFRSFLDDEEADCNEADGFDEVDFDPVEERRLAFELCKSMSPSL